MSDGAIGWIVAAIFAIGWLAGAIRRALVRWRRTRRLHRALRAESAAEHLLEQAGFEIEDRQTSLEWLIECDGEPHPVALRADLIVSRDGQRYVAEVKTGDAAPRLTSANTRRQLLEYAIAYDVDGVLLIDMQVGEIREVRFPL